jgi:hypothetical protein
MASGKPRESVGNYLVVIDEDAAGTNVRDWRRVQNAKAISLILDYVFQRMRSHTKEVHISGMLSKSLNHYCER